MTLQKISKSNACFQAVQRLCTVTHTNGDLLDPEARHEPTRTRPHMLTPQPATAPNYRTLPHFGQGLKEDHRPVRGSLARVAAAPLRDG
jgi:hypothetical protein